MMPRYSNCGICWAGPGRITQVSLTTDPSPLTRKVLKPPCPKTRNPGNAYTLDFEQPIVELEDKNEELRRVNQEVRSI